MPFPVAPAWRSRALRRSPFARRLGRGILLPRLAALLVSALLLVGLLAPLTAATLAAAPVPQAAPQATVPRPQDSEEIRDSGSFHRGKVRILGIPVLTVASPVVAGSQGPDARQRARVIEGNLELLYRAQEVCTTSEGISEQILDQVFLRSGERVCDANQLGLLGPTQELRVEVTGGSAGMPVLQARVPGRELPLPLLSVTHEDARLNGTTPERLAERWRDLLERRLQLARHLVEPGVILRRLRFMAQLELLLLALLILALLFWRRCRIWMAEQALSVAHAPRRVAVNPQPASLSRQRWMAPSPPPSAVALLRRVADRLGVRPEAGLRRGLRLLLLMLLTRMLLGVVLLLLPLIVGVAIMAVPGQIPLAIELLLQPFGVVTKLLLVWLLALLLRTMLRVILSQWHGSPVQARELRARRDQRYFTLLRLSRRLVNLGCIGLVGLWVVIEIPGVRDLSNNAVLASGALLGALALVFQDLLRDFAAGLIILLDDRYAIGDQITIDALSGEVIDVRLLSTELRSADQRVVMIPNSQCKRVVNATKLRSGQELRLTLAATDADPRQALAVLEAALASFAADPAWREDLPQPPRLLGLSEVTPQGLVVALVLITQPGRQDAVRRALLLHLVEVLQVAGIALAEALPAGNGPG